MAKTGTRKMNGEGSIRQRPNGSWEIRYTDPNGKRKSASGKTPDEARAKLTKILHAMDTDQYIEPSNETLGEWIKQWMQLYKKRTLKPKSYYTYAEMYNHYIKDSIGLIRLDKLKGDDIQGWINDMQDDGLSSATIRLAYAVVRGALDKAYQLDKIIRMPTKAVELPRHTRAEKDILSTANYKKLVKNAHNYQLGDVILLMLGTGIRPGEARGLLWKDVDSKKGIIRICSNNQIIGIVDEDLEIIERQPLQQDSTKSDSGIREIPMIGYVKKLFSRLENERKHITHVCVNHKGQILTTGAVTHALNHMLAKLSIPHVSPHALRHTFATQAIENGVDYKTLQMILGHSTLAMTMDLYVQVSPEKIKKEMLKSVK